jgi:hypothetical protein
MSKNIEFWGESFSKDCVSASPDNESAVEAVRVLFKAVWVLLKAVKVLVKALRVIAKAIRVLAKAVRVLVKAIRVLVKAVRVLVKAVSSDPISVVYECTTEKWHQKYLKKIYINF